MVRLVSLYAHQTAFKLRARSRAQCAAPLHFSLVGFGRSGCARRETLGRVSLYRQEAAIEYNQPRRVTAKAVLLWGWQKNQEALYLVNLKPAMSFLGIFSLERSNRRNSSLVIIKQLLTN